MNLFRIWIYSILLLLLLEVLKTFISRITFPQSYFLALIISCIQVLILLGALLMPFIYRLIRKFRRPLMLTIVLFFSLIGILEGVANWMLFHPGKIPSWLMESYIFYYDFIDRTIIQFEDDKTAYHPGLTYTLRPSSRFEFSNAEFNTRYMTNTMGLRDTDSSLVAPAVVCMGDSYTMGWGVEQSETFPVRLAALSGKKILNAGVSSYGTARELELLKRTDQANLQWLVIQYCSNDVVENSEYIDNNFHLPVISEKEFESVQKGYVTNRLYFPGKVFLVIFQHYWKSVINRIYPLFSLPSERIPSSDESMQAQRFAQVLFHAAIDYSKVKVVITRMNAQNFLNGNFMEKLQLLSSRDPYYEKFGKYISILDLKNVVGPSDYFILDVHLKPSGHQKIADTLNRILFSRPAP